ncbi:MAG: SusD/RagB family nutrient-binding outer membrane lipoprotein [Chitinophagaceae bacterium]|nr:SusD/RagB family nutrient-binding outer membrane lipoprotein [Chitinophagaceae bacterium]
MRKLSIHYIILPALAIWAVGCKKFVENGDVNINPNASSNATLVTLLPTVIEATGDNQYRVAFATTNFAQQTAAYSAGFIDFDRNNDVRVEAFTYIYGTGLTNAKILMDLANTRNAPYYAAIGKIMTVINLSMATDLYGDVPYSDAFKAPAVIYPKYDRQEDIYTMMQQYLDEAIIQAQTPAVAGVEVPGRDDLIYNGRMFRWAQAASFLKARLYMHLTKKGAVTASNNALSVLPNAFKPATNDSSELQLIYNTRNLNPWNANIAKRVETGNFFLAPSRRFVETVNGGIYGGVLVDPRISKLMDKRSSPAYVGMPNGLGTGGSVDITQSTYYGRDAAPMQFATYAEQKLLEAEARFLAAGGTTNGSSTDTGSTQEAYDAYLAGITAHMNKLGIDEASKNAYLTHPLIAVTPAKLTMSDIMKEKQIALYLHPEAWVDVRRYDYRASIFKGMALPANQAASMGGQFIRRSGLPNDEVSRNPNSKASVKPLAEKVWWDQ